MKPELQQILTNVLSKIQNWELDPAIFVHRMRQKGFYQIDEQEVIMNINNTLQERRVCYNVNECGFYDGFSVSDKIHPNHKPKRRFNLDRVYKGTSLCSL